MTNREHNRLLAIFFAVMGGLQLFGGIIGGLIYVGMGTFIATQANEPEAAGVAGIMVLFAIVIVGITFVFGGFYLFTGWKLHKLAPAGRIMGIIASFLSLLSVPLGTALGIYGLWFLMGDRGKQFFDSAQGFSEVPPPPPDSWR